MTAASSPLHYHDHHRDDEDAFAVISSLSSSFSSSFFFLSPSNDDIPFHHHHHHHHSVRALTFIDCADAPPTEGEIVIYAILTVLSVLCTIKSFAVGQSRTHYRSFCTIRFLFPFVCFILALENATLAASGRFYDSQQQQQQEEEEQEDFDGHPWIITVFVLQTLEVPVLLIVTFELTYLIHKKRSVNFCGMYFDEGRRVHTIITTPTKSFVLRNFIRAVAIVLLVVGIVVNFDSLNDVARADDMAGRAGWIALFRDERDWEDRVHLLLSLLPTLVLIVCSFYFSFLLWRYGTQFSMVVHSSMANPWFSPFFGTLALTVGQVFDEEWYLLSSHIGLLIFIITIILLMSEVDKDMVAAEEFAVFLEAVSAKGDAVSVQNVMKKRQQREEEEEKQEVDDEEDMPIREVGTFESDDAEHGMEVVADILRGGAGLGEEERLDTDDDDDDEEQEEKVASKEVKKGKKGGKKQSTTTKSSSLGGVDGGDGRTLTRSNNNESTTEGTPTTSSTQRGGLFRKMKAR